MSGNEEDKPDWVKETESEQRMKFVNKPYTEAELEQKVEAMRVDVAKKLNNWSNKIIFPVSSGHKQYVKREEGEQWIENGKAWVVKNGIKQTISKLEVARMPWWCPTCSKPMNHRFDRKFYNIRGWCYDCNINFEHKLRVSGRWEAFERRKIKENQISILKDDVKETLEYIRTFTEPKLYFEDGRYEVLASKAQFADQFRKLESDVERNLGIILQLEKELQEEIDNDTKSVTNT